MSSRPLIRPRRLRSGLIAMLLVLAGCVPDDRPATVDAQAAQARSAPGFVRMAKGALEAGRPEAAVSLAERGLAERPDDPRLLRLYARALQAVGRPGAAADVWRRLLTRERGTLADHLGYARALVASGQAAIAVRHLARREAEFAALAPYWNARGIALAHARRFEDAVAAFARAVAKAPGRTDYRVNLALARALAGDVERARASLAALADDLRSNPRVRHNLALVEVLAGRPEAARRLLRIDLDDRAVEEDLAALQELVEPSGQDAVLARMATVSVPEPPLPAPRRTPPVSAVALDPADLEAGRLPLGDWFLRLGMAADPGAARRRWEALRSAHPALLGDLRRLAGPDAGPRPLLAGPLPSRREAEGRCRALRAAGVGCVPLRL